MDELRRELMETGNNITPGVYVIPAEKRKETRKE
jgi:hypothetical protein